jgi:hypothetical protein
MAMFGSITRTFFSGGKMHVFPKVFLGTALVVTGYSTDEIFHKAIQRANAHLEQRRVAFHQQITPQSATSYIDPNHDILLKIDGEELIDIISLKTVDGQGIKTSEVLGAEILKKVHQHCIAKKTEGILFSASGSKLDVRALKENRVSIDAEGYLRINDYRLVLLSGPIPVILQAQQLRSYTIVRFIEEKGTIRIFDDYDLQRPDNKGMYVNLEELHEGMLVVHRDLLTDSLKQRLREILKSIPVP